MTESIVPTIDLRSWRDGDSAERAAVAAGVDAGCSSIGFLQVLGHGVDTGVIEAMLDVTAEFFALPVAEKRRWIPPNPAINRGYAAKGAESLTYSLGVERPPDLFEAFNIGPDDLNRSDPAVAAEPYGHFADNIWPSSVPHLRPALTAYFAAVRTVADTLLEVFAAALSLPDGYFAPFVTYSTDTMRVNHYETAPGDPDPVTDQVGMGAHTDYGIVTVLYGDEVPGLQIVGPDGAWHDVAPAPNAFLVNLGDLTAQWTNDRWRSTLHRVLPPARLPDRPSSRRSVAFFHDGNWDAVVECLPTCTSAANPPRYEPVTAGEHLMRKVLGPRTLTVSDAVNTATDRLRNV